MIKERLCKNCHQPFEQFNTLDNLCPDCKYKSYLDPPRIRRKTMAYRGRHTKQWLDVDRPKWIKNHPPNHQGYWQCYLQISPRCFRWVNEKTLSLDHVKARSRKPEKRHKQQNLRPSCPPCNELKGSLSIKELIVKYPKSLIARDSMRA